MARQTAAVEAAFAVADRAAAKFPPNPPSAKSPSPAPSAISICVRPNDGWRDRYTQLARWLDIFSQRPSAQATKPPPA